MNSAFPYSIPEGGLSIPRAIFAIWWDDKLGPFIGRTYPEEEPLTTDEAVVIFMGHGVHHEAKIGYTKIPRGLIISYMQSPNCIAVLLEADDDPAVIERNLKRIVTQIDFTSNEWDVEIKQAYENLEQSLDQTSAEKLVEQPKVKRMLDDIHDGRVTVIRPRHVLDAIDTFPDAEQYLGHDKEEVARVLNDLEDAGELVSMTYGRTIECRQCGSHEVTVTLLCPNCESKELYNVYSVFCPKCSNSFQAVLVDDLREVTCQKCKQSVKVGRLSVLGVEPLCNSCGTATNDPKIVLTCALCGKQMDGADLLGGTGLAYYPKNSIDQD